MATKGNACSRPSVYQVIYQVAFFCKVVALVIFAFNQMAEAVYSGILWALLAIDLFLLGVVFLCQVCASIRLMARDILKPKVVALILAVLVVFGIGESIMLALKAFNSVNLESGVLKATFVFDLTSAILVLSLVFLYLFWAVDDLGKAKDAVDAELGSAAGKSVVHRTRSQTSVKGQHSSGNPRSVSKRSLSRSHRSTKLLSDRHNAPKIYSARSRSARESSARSSSVRTGRSSSHHSGRR